MPSTNERLAVAAERIAASAERIADALVRMSPCMPSEIPQTARWHYDESGGHLLPLSLADFDLSQLHGLESQLQQVSKNIRAFVRGKPANHLLLSGPRGSGKSSLVRGVLARECRRGLRVIETDVYGLAHLPHLLSHLGGQRYVVYCDDLSFGRAIDLPLFQRLKSAIEGTLSGADNVLVCATSNRRHLAAEFFADNLSAFDSKISGEIHGNESIDETLSLSDRFGLRISFFDLDDADYFNIVRHWLNHFGVRVNDSHLQRARLWADERGGLNGRAAYQFAIAVANGTVD